MTSPPGPICRLPAHAVSGAGSWVVFLHSLGLDRHSWSAQAAAFARTHAVLTYDLRGHGESPDDAPCTLDAHVHDLLRLLDHVGAEQVTLVGLSMGGFVAARAAAHHPGRVERLVLADTTAWYGPGGAASWTARAATVRREGMGPLVATLMERWFTPAFRREHADVVAAYADVLSRNDPEAYAAHCDAIAGLDLRPGLDAIRAPTLVIVGAEDTATPPAAAAALHQGIRGSRLVVIPNAAHLSPVEQPDAFNAAVRALLSA